MRNAERDARVTSGLGAVSTAPIAGAPALQFPGAPSQRTVGWWTVLAMLLAWVVSLPISASSFDEPNGSLAWADHLLVTMPTVVSFPAMAWFLWKVPVPTPTLRRVAGAVVQVPIFLTVGILSFLLTLGIGSFVFAWIVWWQAQVATTMKERVAA